MEHSISSRHRLQPEQGLHECSPSIRLYFVSHFEVISRHNLTISYHRKRDGNQTDAEVAQLFSVIVGFQNGLETETESVELDAILKLNNVTLSGLKDAISPTCANMFERCMWKGTQTRCDTLFQRVDTTYGDCCSFNYYGLEKNNYPTSASPGF